MGDSKEISLENLAEILQKFGLEMITQFGKTTHNIKILTNKIDEFYTTMIDIKGFMPLLNRIIESQHVLESEIDLLKSLIQRANISITQEELEKISTEREKSIEENKKSIKNKFTNLLNIIEKIEDPKDIKIELENIKRNIFEFLGGHKISYEISKVITKIENVESFSDEVKNEIKEKITFWISKL
jgi:hypothetical protein